MPPKQGVWVQSLVRENWDSACCMTWPKFFFFNSKTLKPALPVVLPYSCSWMWLEQNDCWLSILGQYQITLNSLLSAAKLAYCITVVLPYSHSLRWSYLSLVLKFSTFRFLSSLSANDIFAFYFTEKTEVFSPPASSPLLLWIVFCSLEGHSHWARPLELTPSCLLKDIFPVVLVCLSFSGSLSTE